jgi:hypothetical protein
VTLKQRQTRNSLHAYPWQQSRGGLGARRRRGRPLALYEEPSFLRSVSTPFATALRVSNTPVPTVAHAS